MNLDAIRSVATRVEVIGRATLIQADCREVLPLLPKVDAVVTSPPYDNLREYEGQGPLDCLPIISMIAEVLKDGGVCMWNVADATINGSETGTSFRHALHAMECGLRLHDTMIYIRENISVPENNRYFSGFEYMFVFSNGSPCTFNPIKDRLNKWRGTIMHGTDRQRDGTTKQSRGNGKMIEAHGMRFNYWLLTNNEPDTGHPAPMPYGMASGHIASWTNPNNTILDPFMGSGTTGVAAVQMGRDFIGIEREPKYFDIACKRIDDAQRQGDLFIGDAA